MSITAALRAYVEPSHVDLYNLGAMSTGGIYGTWSRELSDENFVFSIVRNPYDKMVSNYHYSGRGQGIWGTRYSFAEFCEAVVTREMPENWRHHTQMPTRDYITFDGELVTDYVIRFENLEQGFRDVLERIGLGALPLPHLNRSRRDTHYRDSYCERSRAIVEQIFEPDLEHFGYSF